MVRNITVQHLILKEKQKQCKIRSIYVLLKYLNFQYF